MRKEEESKGWKGETEEKKGSKGEEKGASLQGIRGLCAPPARYHRLYRSICIGKSRR